MTVPVAFTGHVRLNVRGRLRSVVQISAAEKSAAPGILVLV